MDAKDPTYIDQYVGRRVRLRRGELDLSQEALAEKLGITFQQLQKYENGRNRVSAGRLYELARTLETTIMYFYNGVETLGSAYARGVSEEGAEFKGQADSEAIDLMIAFREIRDASQRKSILATVKKSAAGFSPPLPPRGGRPKRKR
ncbi:MAG: helix-turn-helix transcriptional regulator [Hyphomonadaceae bacterium]|nr:helix-turn-helix transcriptional regulator [Hyphomonadaceae bacterium]